ncbi:MAG: MFS transporter [Chloroflexi bacterium]|nr:MFS transporter [Chloroflexota bacterium]
MTQAADALASTPPASATAASAPSTPTTSTPTASTRAAKPRVGRQMFRALRHREYRLYWIGLVVSQTGTWMQSIAQAWLVLQLTDSPLALGSLTSFQALPVLFFALFGGVVADRLPKRRLLLGTQSLMLVQALTLGILTWGNWITLWQLYAMALMLGVLNALDNPTRQAFVSELVGTEDLPNAVALNSLVFNVSRLVGPALGGVTIALVGVAGCFLLNSASFLAVIVGLLLMRPIAMVRAASRERRSLLGHIGEGLAYALRTPDALLVVILMAVIGMFGYNFSVILPLIAEYVLDADAAAFGTLTSAVGVGSIVASLFLARAETTTRRRLLLGGAGFSVLFIALAMAQSWVPILAILVMIGIFSITFSSTANIRLQTVTPPHLRGRVMSIYTLLFLGSTPIGGLVVGALAQYQGVQVAVAELGVICTLGVVAALVYALRTWGFAAAAGPDTAPAELLGGAPAARS